MASHKVKLDGRPEGIQLVEIKRSSANVSKGTFTSVVYRSTDPLHSYHQKTYPDGREEWTHLWADPVRAQDMRKKYAFQTRLGPFYIAELDDRWYSVFGEEALGSSNSAKSVAEMLAEGFLFSHDGIENVVELKIPADIRQWHKLP